MIINHRLDGKMNGNVTPTSQRAVVYFRMIYFTILILLTILLVSCVKSHSAIHGRIINETGIINTTLVWQGYTECYGRGFFDINPWFDKGMTTSSEKHFTALVHDDGSFTFPGAVFWSSLRQKNIRYSCTLLDSSGRALGHLSSPFRDQVVVHLYIQTVRVDLHKAGHTFPRCLPENIRLRLTLRDKYAGEHVDEVPLQTFLDAGGHTFSRPQLVEGNLQPSTCTINYSIIDEYDNLLSLPIRNGEEGVWRVNYEPRMPIIGTFPGETLYHVLKAWPVRIENGEAVKWSRRDEVVTNPPDYFQTLKTSIHKMKDM